MQIRYAISTMVFWFRENPLSLEQECQFIKSLGFGVELRPTIKGLDECRFSRRNWSRLATATEDMLVSMYSRTDEPTLEQWDEQIECAKFLGADIVTSLRSFGIPQSAEVDGCDFSKEVVKMADDKNVQLCLETGNLSKIKHLGEKFESVRYCLDIGFINLDPVYSFKQYVDELGPRVAYLHLNDNYGLIDDHEPPGIKGGISVENWDYLYKTLDEYDNQVTACFEMSPSSPSTMIRHAGEFLFDKLNWPNQPQKQPDDKSTVYKPG